MKHRILRTARGCCNPNDFKKWKTWALAWRAAAHRRTRATRQFLSQVFAPTHLYSSPTIPSHKPLQACTHTPSCGGGRACIVAAAGGTSTTTSSPLFRSARIASVKLNPTCCLKQAQYMCNWFTVELLITTCEQAVRCYF